MITRASLVRRVLAYERQAELMIATRISNTYERITRWPCTVAGPDSFDLSPVLLDAPVTSDRSRDSGLMPYPSRRPEPAKREASRSMRSR
jgi:hypothetical protein